MRAFLDGIFSIDLPAGPPQLPEDPEDCWVVVQAGIGPIDGSGADTFTFYVCTPKRLGRALDQEGYRFGYHLILVKQFDWDVVERAIKRLVDRLEGDNWEDLAGKFGRFGEWEFEDYVEYEAPK